MTAGNYTPEIRSILMTADTIGGVWTYALELSEALQPYGIRIFLATMGAPLTGQQREAAERIQNIKLFESSYKLEWMDNPWQDVAAAGKWLLGLGNLLQPDIIHLNDYAHAALQWQAPVLVVAHSCVYSWYHAVKGTPPSEMWYEYKEQVTRGIQGANAVTAPTNAMLSVLNKHYGPFNKTRAIYNARKAGEFLPGIKSPFILSAGRLWDEAKNVSALACTAPRLNWPVYVAGEKEDPDGRSIEFEGVGWLGRLPARHLASWMSRASIFALPARYEPFGLSALEAALAGCALVLGDIPSLREVWGGAAWFVPPDDYDSLAFALNKLADNEMLRQRYISKSRKRALSYSPKRMAKEYLALYKSMLDARRSKPGKDRSRIGNYM